jgi:hypothetical protein
MALTHGPRMVLSMDFEEIFPVQMSINLGCINTGMTEQFLHDPQIGAAFEEMSREGMTKSVRSHFFSYSGFHNISMNQFPHSGTTKTPPEPGDKQPVAVFSPFRQLGPGLIEI